MAEIQTLNLNRATADQIADANIEGIDETLAMSLVEYRDEHGPFESFDELKDIPGFNDQLVERLQENGATLGMEESEEIE